MDAGDFLGAEDELAGIKARFLLSALGRLGQDAVTLGELDFLRGPEFPLRAADSSGVPLVSANLLRRDTGLPLVEPYLIRRVGGKRVGPWVRGGYRIGIFGVLMSDEGRVAGKGDDFPLMVSDPITVARRTARLLAEEKACHMVIALSHLGVTESRELARTVAGVDLVVSGHGGGLLEEPERLGNALMVHAGDRGMYLGDLTFTLRPEAPPTLVESRVVTLGEEVPGDSAMVAFMEEYREAFHRFLDDPQEFPASLEKADQVYVGVRACVPCHQEIVSSWSETAHARAFADLEETGDEVNPECVRCHTTGYRMANGFHHRKWTPHLTDVQCESCHGPGVWHLARLEGLKPAAGDFPSTDFLEIIDYNCEGCHRSDRDPDFDFARDRELILH